MKKLNKVVLFYVVLAVFFTLAGCGKTKQSGEQLVALVPKEVTEITVTHIRGSKETIYILEDTQLDDLREWASSLSMEHKVYTEDTSPGNKDGGEVYNFNMGGGYTAFSYIINGGNNCYILLEDQWYEVGNPTDPFNADDLEASNQEEPIKWARIPMLMVNGELYLDTGKETHVEENEMVSGTILSSVDGTMQPSKEGESNFGLVGNRYVAQDDAILVNIDEKWFIFRKEKRDE